jgi:nitrate/nitrite transport system substrate-binding protein
MVKSAPDYQGIAKRVMRPELYVEAMKEMGNPVAVQEQQKITLFDGSFDGVDPDKYALSFPVKAVA